MTEEEWPRCERPAELLVFLRDALRQSKGARRKVRLLLAAWCRRGWHGFKDARSRRLIETSERYADGAVAFSVLKAAWDAGRQAHQESTGSDPRWAYAACCAGHRDIWQGALDTWASLSVTGRAGGPGLENPEQAGLIRDVFGSLAFRAAKVGRHWLTPDVRATAQAAYEERLMPSGELDPVRLAVLADALEDAGCTDKEVLSHLGSEGPHVRGCWVVDLILGKE